MKPHIAFLAPEIPGLTTPFVYREILALRNKGFLVLPVSIHSPVQPSTEDGARNLAKETINLYDMGIVSFLIAALICKLRHPIRYIYTVFSLLGDILRTGIFTREAAALVYRFLAAARLSLILEKHGCRHLHAHFADAPTDIAMYAARLADIPFSFTSHSGDLFAQRPLLIKKVARSAKAVTISEYNRRFIITQGADGEKIVVIRYGIDGNKFGNERSEENSPVAKPPLIGSMGRLVEKKGFDTLIKAANLLAREGLKFRIEIAGDGPLKNRLETLSRHSGAFDCVTFIGALPDNMVTAWLSKLDLFVLASQLDSNGDMDSIPLPLIEAMAAGVPVVSTILSAIPELIENGVSGLLTKPADVDALAESIWNLLDDPELRNQCIRAGRIKVEEKFSEDLSVDRLGNLFMEILFR